MHTNCGKNHATGMSESTWQAQANWMRAVHASEASWDDAGNLRSLKLAELPPAPDANTNPAKRMTADAKAQHDRAERRRIGLMASGGPVRRVSEPTD